MQLLPTFTVLTDHRPVIGIFRKKLHKLDNACLMRMREKFTNFSLDVKWVEGKTHISLPTQRRRGRDT